MVRKPRVHPQEDLYVQFYGISFMHIYKKSNPCHDMSDTAKYQRHPNVDQTAVMYA